MAGQGRELRGARRFSVTLLQALVLLGVGTWMAAAGRGSHRHLSDLQSLCVHCWSVAPLALQRFGTRWQLTHRELQTARCAATGSTNREIAEHLGVSERTVAGHLQRVYDKLGVHSRTRLAFLLHEAGASP